MFSEFSEGVSTKVGLSDHKEYGCTVMMAVKSKPSSLFGDRLLQMN
jgi:hypothetical protein